MSNYKGFKLVDPSRTGVMEIVDQVGTMLLCVFFKSKRSVWLEVQEVKTLAENLHKRVETKKVIKPTPESMV